MHLKFNPMSKALLIVALASSGAASASEASLKWTFSLDTTTQHRAASSDDGTTYITTNDYLYAINSDGSEKWRHHTAGSSFLSPAVGPDGTIYVSSRGNESIAAFNSNGTNLWQHKFSDYVFVEFNVRQQPSVSSNGDVYQVVSGSPGNPIMQGVNVFKVKNGQSSRVIGDIASIEYGPTSITYEGEVYFPLMGEIATVSRKLYQKHLDLETSSSYSFDKNKRLYVVGDIDNGALFAFDRTQAPSSSPSWDWSWRPSGNARVSHSNAPIIGAGGNIYVTSYENAQQSLHAITPAGTQSWQYTGVKDNSPVAAADGTIYAVSASGDLLALNSQSGTLKWQYTPPAPISGDISMDNHGVIYATSSNSRLFAIQTPSTTAADTGWPMKGQNMYGTYAQPGDYDKDGILNVNDNCPNAANPDQLNTDGANDGGDACDDDDDNDGFADIYDAFPAEQGEYFDTDGDGIGNNADLDDDNDGILDSQDSYPLDHVNVTLGPKTKWFSVFSEELNKRAVISANEDIYVSSLNNVYKLNSKGELTWQQGYGTFPSKLPVLTFSGDIQFINSANQKEVISLNSSGDLNWKSSFSHPVTDLSVFDSNETLVNVQDTFWGNVIYSVDVQGQNQKDRFENTDFSSGPLSVTKEGAVFSSHMQGVKQLNTAHSRFEYKSIDFHFGSVSILTNDSRLYVIACGPFCELLAFDSKAGANATPLWRWSLSFEDPKDGTLIHTQPILGQDNNVYVLTKNQNLSQYSLVSISHNGQLQWEYAGVKNQPALAAKDGTVYVISKEGDLVALSNKGDKLWQYKALMPLDGSLVMDDSGIIYVYSVDKQLFAIQTASPGPADSGWPMIGQNPQNTSAQPIIDKDGDGVADTLDNCPDIANPDQLNTDKANDGGNACDTDDDNDGIADTADAFPIDANESVDTDKDGIGNNADSDDDNDGVADTADAFPLDASEYQDHDYDGIGNNADPDDDGDGVFDINDAFPTDASETLDSDGDGIGNNADTDDDNDGVSDSEDAFPFDASESTDTDKDGTGNNADADDDNDGVLDTDDAFPLDAAESLDSDKDGIGNNADTDDDNDGLSDVAESELGTSPVLADTDGDGINDPDEAQYGTSPVNFDTDGDGLSDGFEITYGFDPLLKQSDGSADTDSDSDGLTNAQEMTHGTHPNKADTDEDGLNDGIEVNTHGTNPLNADSDNDGLTDIAEIDEHRTNPLKADSDDDQMPDSWEVQYRLDAMADDSTLDTDNDHRDNLTEFKDQTNPQVAEVLDVEQNETLATAQKIDHAFNLVFSKDIGDSKQNTSQTLPHVTIMGKGKVEHDVDVYEFTVVQPNSKVILDIDRDISSTVRFDSFIELFNASGTMLYANDDANWHKQGQDGSVSVTDSYMELIIEQPGTYYVRVSSYLDGFVPQNAAYMLHISVEHAPVVSDTTQQP